MRKSVFLLVILVATVIGGFALFGSSPQANAQKGSFQAHSLLDASVGEVEKAAIDYTQSRFRVFTTPEVLLAQKITKEEVRNLGLSPIFFGGRAPPLALVALRGDFEVTLRGMIEPQRVKYIFYVIDLNVGGPTKIEYSRDGQDYEQLLEYASKVGSNDLNQPIDPEAIYFQPAPIQTAIPVSLPDTSTITESK